MLEVIATSSKASNDLKRRALFGLGNLATAPDLRDRARKTLSAFDRGDGTALSNQAHASLKQLE